MLYITSYFIIAFIAGCICGGHQSYWDRETFFFVIGVSVLWPVALIWDALLWLEGEL